MSIPRTEILKGSYVYPEEMIKLRPTTHFLERLEERGIGIDCIPTLVRVTKDNIYSAEPEGNLLRNVVVRLEYNSQTYLFLAFETKKGALKTLWFKDKRRKSDSGGRGAGAPVSEQAVRDTRTDHKV
jgi:hypothetical protein